MNADSRPAADTLVPATEIARLAGVTRAAVSNWRKRYPDFPAPVGGGPRNALFALPEVRAWLDRHHRGGDVSVEVQLWQALRGVYGDDMMRGIADVTEMLSGGAANRLDARVVAIAKDLAGESSPTEVVEALVEGFVDSAGRVGADQVTSPRLVRAVRHFAGTPSGTIFDPACGIGSLLLSFEGTPDVTLAGQEMDASAVRLAGRSGATIKEGDSLREDGWPDLRAELVVCDPPVNMPDWGRDDLLLDARWEFGVPPRAESELTWLQHCYAHVAPGGQAIVVMPASAAYRKAGRRIRAELVRRGILTQVIGLPPGMVASHAQPVHLWLLARPVATGAVGSSVRMVDLTAYDPEGPFDLHPKQVVDVPLIELLDEAVDLTPAYHVATSRSDHLVEYLSAREALLRRLDEMRDLLPSLGSGPGSLEGAAVRIADLARAGLVDISTGVAVSTSDQLDTDYLNGFARSTANTRRSTSGSGGFRTDLRSSRIPQMGIEDQRRYGEAFRTIDAFEQATVDLTTLIERAVTLAREGLTGGALRPGESSE
ncbi:N-6 DNA methylase [Acrocarpospora catenulata]|uniref:N-6 DNA methylase n=1 Tax=Acrocarpospora catenulata TaxID=2836182 RepID=UPI001BDB6790|nr:N-6 DNA methylase [Acrocarpospora catenulata]